MRQTGVFVPRVLVQMPQYQHMHLTDNPAPEQALCGLLISPRTAWVDCVPEILSAIKSGCIVSYDEKGLIKLCDRCVEIATARDNLTVARGCIECGSQLDDEGECQNESCSLCAGNMATGRSEAEL